MSEKLKDIIEEMRRGMIPKHRHDRELLLNFADRIEAAMEAECEELHKRIKLWLDRADELRKKCDEQYAVIKQNLTTEKTSAVGNAAKMREALEDSNGLLEELALIGEWFESARGQIAENKAALSAPARNCDKYLTPKDAMLAHLDDVYEGEKVEFGDYEWCEFIKWLFAEAKGETK